MTINNNVPVVHHRSFTGLVARANGQKTIVVNVEQKMMHKKYRKQYVHSERYQVHDENSVAKVGDRVVFVECRPISKTKRWRFIEVIKA